MRRWRAAILALGAALTGAAAVAVAGLPLVARAPIAADLTPPERDVLGGVQHVPTLQQLQDVFGADVDQDLIAIAEGGPDIPAGVRLRAIRGLIELSDAGQRSDAAAALRDVIDDEKNASAGTGTLVLRASAISLARLDGESAVTVLTPLLTHPVRDVRADAATALGVTGSAEAIPALRAQDLEETVLQVKLAIADALRRLGQEQ